MRPYGRTPGPSRGARGPNAQLGGIEPAEDTGVATPPQGSSSHRHASGLVLRAIHNRAGHFLGLEVVRV